MKFSVEHRFSIGRFRFACLIYDARADLQSDFFEGSEQIALARRGDRIDAYTITGRSRFPCDCVFAFTRATMTDENIAHEAAHGALWICRRINLSRLHDWDERVADWTGRIASRLHRLR